MRSFSPKTSAYFASRRAFMGHLLLWVSPRNRATGVREPIGFWTGVDHQQFVVDGQSRLYFAAGSLLKMEPIRRQTGLRVRTHRISLSQIAPEVQVLIREYDARGAPAEVHRVLLDPSSELPIDHPHPLVQGFVDKAVISTAGKGAASDVALEIASEARSLTKPLSRSRSDATLRARASSDGFRKYAGLTESVEVQWGR